ncbi:MAG: hypothetical protein AAGA75_28670 [Cyanobacteria bacterium P01_E01_bin.6]
MGKYLDSIVDELYSPILDELKGVKGDRPDHLAHIPERWEDFARITKIRSGTEMLSFNPYSFQLRISDTIDRCRGTVIVKPRQHGLTEMVANKFLHKACLYPTYFAAVFSKGQDDTANIAKRVRLMAASANIELSSNNVKDIEVSGGGRIVFKTATPNSGRGLESVWDILYDECAFVQAIEQLYGAATPSQSVPEQQGRARTILLSTPNAKEGLYFDTFTSHNGDRDALEICQQMRDEEIDPYQEWVDENNWGKCIIHWRSHPIHGKNDRYLQDVAEKQRITWAQVQREYNISFDDSTGGTLFNSAAIDAQAIGEWTDSEIGCCYLMGIDPNFGGDDFFVCQVWEVSKTPARLVAEYRESGRSTEYSQSRVGELIDKYSPSLVAVESNSGGKVILERLIKLRPMIHFEGVNTSRQSKVVNTDRVAIAIEQGEVIYPPDWEGIREMKKFALKGREAISGHDDEVMAFAAAWAWRDAALSLNLAANRLSILS